jgi:hypothetical protein
MNMRIWTKEAKEELNCIGLALLRLNQQDCSKRDKYTGKRNV